jgi:uncharacterized cofD-like protein
VDLLLLGLGIWGAVLAVRRGLFSAVTVLAPRKRLDDTLSFLGQDLRRRRGPKVAAVGGGTGMPNTLRGLKPYTSNISAVVTVADDGGSSGRLRKDFHMPPPGDIRNCLVALAGSDTLMHRLFQHRFGRRGDLSGHSFGNLFLAALGEVTGDFAQAVRESSRVLAIEGRVIPVSPAALVLKARLEDGRVIEGQSRIGETRRIRRIGFKGKTPDASRDALQALRAADAIVLGPGSLFTSVIPNLIVRGVAEEIRRSPAPKIYVCNVMTQPGETENFTASAHLKAIREHAGEGLVDTVLVHRGEIQPALLRRYAREGAVPVAVDREALRSLGVRVVEADVASTADFVRHDPRKLGRVLMKLILV